MCADINGQTNGSLFGLIFLVLLFGYQSYHGYLAWFRPSEYNKFLYRFYRWYSKLVPWPWSSFANESHNFYVRHPKYTLWSARIFMPFGSVWAVFIMVIAWRQLVQLSAAATVAGCH